jgi:hypothetical protein
MATKMTSLPRETYLLLEEHATIKLPEKKSSKFSLKLKGKKEDKKRCEFLSAGTLLHECSPQTDGQEAVYTPVSGSDSKEFHISCPSSVVMKLVPKAYELLAAIHNCGKRIEVFNDKAWITEGLVLSLGDHVKIQGHTKVPDGSIGHVISKGPLDDKTELWFVVQLVVRKFL